LTTIVFAAAILTFAAFFVIARDFQSAPKSAPFELYEVGVSNQAEADRLSALNIDPILRLDDGFLILIAKENLDRLFESGLAFEYVASDISRDDLALDISFDKKNALKYPVIYDDKGIVLLRVSLDEVESPDGKKELAPLPPGHLRISYNAPAKLDFSKRYDGMDLETLIGMVEQDSLQDFVETLQAFPPRVTGSASGYASRDWIYGKFTDFGYDSVVFDSFTYGGNNVQNIIAYKVGTTYPDHHIIVGGHKDAVSGSPGADDNGSGTAGVLEIARVLKDIPTEMTFVFICFTGEEQGLNGSEHYADAAAARGDSIVMMLNMDMIGYQGNTNDVKVYHGSDLTWPNLWLDLADSLSTNMNGVLSGTITASDHYPFQQNGYDVVFLIEYNFSSVYHTYRDSTSYMDFSYMARIVRASLATAYQANILYVPTPGLAFSYPGGRPETVYPGETTTFQVQVEGSSGGTVVPGSGIMYYRADGGIADSVLMSDLGTGLYEATIPSHLCEDGVVEYWLGADEQSEGRMYDGSPADPYKAIIATTVTVAFEDDFETDRGWNISGGLWSRGTPTGGGGAYGGPDPSGAYQGSNVMGYNLNGDYTNGMPEYHVTTPMIDCTDIQNVKLSFMRWLGVEQPLYDHAYVRVSNNGTTWTTIWENSEEVYDGAWVPQEFDISSIADGNQIYVRFTMGESDGAWTYCGWNIDNFQVVGYECDQTQMAIVTDDVPDWTAGTAYSYQLESVGGTGTKTWSDMNDDLIGTGLTLSGNGLLSGMPASSGEITFTAMVTDENLNTVDKPFTFMINPDLAITTTAVNEATRGKIYSFTMQCTGGTGSRTWSDVGCVLQLPRSNRLPTWWPD